MSGMSFLRESLPSRPALGEGRVDPLDSAHPMQAACISYAESDVVERQAEDLGCLLPLDPKRVTWLSVHGATEVGLLEPLAAKFSIHPLTLGNILNTSQRPKLEDFGDYVFIDLNMLWYDETQGVRAEQVSLILGSHYVISFQRNSVDVFNGVRERLRTGKGRSRKMGADYLAYALVDTVVDNYFAILEGLGERSRIGGAARCRPRPGDAARDPSPEARADLPAQVGVAAARSGRLAWSGATQPWSSQHRRSTCATSTTIPSRSSIPSRPYATSSRACSTSICPASATA